MHTVGPWFFFICSKNHDFSFFFGHIDPKMNQNEGSDLGNPWFHNNWHNIYAVSLNRLLARWWWWWWWWYDDDDEDDDDDDEDDDDDDDDHDDDEDDDLKKTTDDIHIEL